VQNRGGFGARIVSPYPETTAGDDTTSLSDVPEEFADNGLRVAGRCRCEDGDVFGQEKREEGVYMIGFGVFLANCKGKFLPAAQACQTQLGLDFFPTPLSTPLFGG
jgi:hypothetical protein